jgi:hypothetical protein
MNAKITQMLAILLVAAIASPAFAADKDEKKGKKAAKHKCPSSAVTCGVKLTADQKAEVKKLVKSRKDALAKAKESKDKAAHKTASKEFRTAVLALLTDDQKAEIKEKRVAAKKAKAEKKPKAEKKTKGEKKKKAEKKAKGDKKAA